MPIFSIAETITSSNMAALMMSLSKRRVSKIDAIDCMTSLVVRRGVVALLLFSMKLFWVHYERRPDVEEEYGSTALSNQVRSLQFRAVF